MKKTASKTAAKTLKLPRSLEARIVRAAKQSGRTPHGFMIEALERETSRTERMKAFLDEAHAADRATEASGEVYDAADVHEWFARVATGGTAPRPKPWRG